MAQVTFHAKPHNLRFKPNRRELHVTILLTALIALSAGFAAPDRIPPQPVEGRIHWVYDYAEGKKQASLEGKPLFVIFRCER